MVGVLATAAAVTVIQPVLLPCLLLAALPDAVTAVKMARRQHLTWLARINRRRRMWMLAHLMADRHTAAEVRAYQMREFLLAEYHRMMVVETGIELRLARAQSVTRAAGMSASDTHAVLMLRVADRAEHHRAETVDAHLDAGAAEDAVTHGCSLRSAPP